MATVATARLTRLWPENVGILPWLSTVDHKAIGRRYIATAFFTFVVAGLLAVTMRTQLYMPLNNVLTPEQYDQLFSVHGTTMIFFFATPIQFGLGNFLVPLMIGARDMAFPRLNAFGYWVFLFAFVFLYSSFFVGAAPDGGWFSYTPMTGAVYTPGLNEDFYTLSLIFLAFSSTAGAINFIVTIFKMRAPGMSINRLPLFLWAILITSFAVIFAVPSLTADNILLELDRRFQMHFFDPRAGGDPLLWQHLFWVFGHPDVYIIFLPAVGMVSTMVPVFARRPMAAHNYVALATVATGIIAFGVWVHHMFAVGLPQISYSFFSAASMIIVIPSGVQMIAWLVTLIRGRPVISVPLLWVLGFFILFTVGGVTGVMFAAVPLDQQLTDSYFVVAHLHYVLIGGAVFPILGAIYFWFPKMTGRLLDDRLGIWTFWITFVGFNLTFFPMHITGLLGMPRRIYTYQPGRGWDIYNHIETVGAYILALGVLLYILNALVSYYRGREAGDNPWHADTLEWTTASPPPPYNFARIPIVKSKNPAWEPADQSDAPVLDSMRETLGTTVLDAEPEGRILIPPDSILPLVLAVALALFFIGFIADLPWLAIVGVIGGLIVLGAWFWPAQAAEATA